MIRPLLLRAIHADPSRLSAHASRRVDGVTPPTRGCLVCRVPSFVVNARRDRRGFPGSRGVRRPQYGVVIRRRREAEYSGTPRILWVWRPRHARWADVLLRT
eukprot:2273657-Pyramimonas_sp.AAC.1